MRLAPRLAILAEGGGAAVAAACSSSTSISLSRIALAICLKRSCLPAGWKARGASPYYDVPKLRLAPDPVKSATYCTRVHALFDALRAVYLIAAWEGLLNSVHHP